MTKDEKEAFGCLLGIPALLIVWPLSAACYGWTLSILWGWFIAPQFALPRLSVLSAIGLMLVVQLITIRRSKSDDSKTLLQVTLEAMAFVVLICGFSLAEGYIVHALMLRG